MLRVSRLLPRTFAPAGAALVLMLPGGLPEAQAAGNANAKMMFMSLLPTTKNACVRTILRPDNCNGYDTVNNLPLYPAVSFVYTLVVQGSQTQGIAGAGFGVDYDGAPQSGVDIWAWQNCADSESPDSDWPGAGSGNVVTFNATTNCQSVGNAYLGAVAVLGYFYSGAYTPDVLRVTPHPGTGVGTVRNCPGVVDTVYSSPQDCATFFGALGFGGDGGINPCGDSRCPPDLTPCIEGPSTVTVGTVTEYLFETLNLGLQGPVSWAVTGPAEIISHDALWKRVEVLATGPGTYTLRPRVCYHVPHLFCSNCLTHSVVVEEAVPTVSTTWGRIKVLVR